MRFMMFLVLSWVCSTVVAADPPARETELKKLLDLYQVAEAGFNRDHGDPGDDLLKIIARYDAWPAWSLAPALLDFAEASPEDKVALRACRRVLDLSSAVGVTDRRTAQAEDRAWSVIERYHLTDDSIAELCILAGHYPSQRRVRFLETVLADGQGGRSVRAAATFALAELRFSQFTTAEISDLRGENRAPFAKWLNENRVDHSVEAGLTADNAPRFAGQARDLYRQVLSEFADIPAGEGRGSARGLETFGQRASQRVFALDHLSIGSTAPDIDGVDLNGRPLKLSDFRGKVVLLTFWFSGCGPCIGMLPQEKKLVEDLRGQPYQMLSVCNDPKIEEGLATATEKGMDWPNWFDGAPWQVATDDVKDLAAPGVTSGAISKQWNVRGWPTIYVLDQAGVIRAKHLRGEPLDAVIHKLVSEAGPRK